MQKRKDNHAVRHEKVKRASGLMAAKRCDKKWENRDHSRRHGQPRPNHDRHGDEDNPEIGKPLQHVIPAWIMRTLEACVIGDEPPNRNPREIPLLRDEVLLEMPSDSPESYIECAHKQR